MKHDFNQQGSGIGLSICANLIKILNIKIEFASKENIGSIFSVLIPVKKIEIDISKNFFTSNYSFKSKKNLDVNYAEKIFENSNEIFSSHKKKKTLGFNMNCVSNTDNSVNLIEKDSKQLKGYKSGNENRLSLFKLNKNKTTKKNLINYNFDLDISKRRFTNHEYNFPYIDEIDKRECSFKKQGSFTSSSYADELNNSYLERKKQFKRKSIANNEHKNIFSTNSNKEINVDDTKINNKLDNYKKLISIPNNSLSNSKYNLLDYNSLNNNETYHPKKTQLQSQINIDKKEKNNEIRFKNQNSKSILKFSYYNNNNTKNNLIINNEEIKTNNTEISNDKTSHVSSKYIN